MFRFFDRRPKVGVLFVCMGNVCRSPTVEGVFRRHARDAGIERLLRIDSAGTHARLLNEPADARALRAAARRNYDLKKIRSRQFVERDFSDFHYVLAMDRHNLDAIQALRPAEHPGHVGLLLDFAPGASHREVPDPYYGGPEGFELVLDLAESAMAGLVKELQGRVSQS